MKALEQLKKAVSMKSAKRVVELPDGSEFEFWMTPMTLAERTKAQKQARTEDTTDFALQLLVTKAKHQNGTPLFTPGDIAALRNELPAAVVESLMLKILSDDESEEDAEYDMKSNKEGSSEG